MTPAKKRFTEDFISKWSKAAGEKETSGAKDLLTRQKKLLKKDPNNPRLLMAHGETLQKLGRFGESLEFLKKAAELDPELPGILLSISTSQLYSGDPEAATANLKKSLAEVCRRSGHPYLQVIESGETLEDIIGPSETAPAAAEPTEPVPEVFDSEEDRRRNSVETLMGVPGIGRLKAEVLYDAGFRSVNDLIDATVEELSEVEGIGKKTAQKIKIVVTFEARAFEETGQEEDVIPDELDEIECPLCKTIMPASSAVCYECGMKFKEEGGGEGAADLHNRLKTCEDTLAVNPGDIEAWYEKGEILFALDRNDEAIDAFNQVTRIDPNYPGVWNLKAEVFTKMGEHQKAASCYKRAMELGVTTAVTEPDEEMEDLLKELETFESDSDITKEAWMDEQSKVKKELRKLSDRDIDDELDLGGDDDIDDEDAELFDSLTKTLDSAVNGQKEADLPDLDDDDVRQIETVTKDVSKESRSLPADAPEVGEEDEKDIDYITKPVQKEARSRPAMDAEVTEEEAKKIDKVTKPLVAKSPEQKTRGMTNGQGRGMTNGLAKKGFVNGTGRTNGLTNGQGRTNGLTNGVGRTNGLTNGQGRTNGLTNGVTNGLTNGLTNGVTNGLTNGLRALRGGMTNGLTNGTGLTNGLGGKRFTWEVRKNKWKLYIIPLVTFLLLMVPMLTPTTVETEAYTINIDGSFADWEGLGLVDSGPAAGDFNSNIDIISGAAENNNGRYLAFYAEVSGTMLAGQPVTDAGYMDFFHFFMDTDNDASTGYFIDGMGADYMVEVRGWNNGVEAAQISSFSADHDTDDWRGFRVMGTTRAAVDEHSLETQIEWASIGFQESGEVAVLVHSQSYDGHHDYSDTFLSSNLTVVSAVQTGVAPETITGTGQLLQVDVNAVNADATVNGITLELLGTVLPAELTALRVESSDGTVLGRTTTITPTTTVPLGDFAVSEGTTAALYIEADVASAAAGKTIGFEATAVDVFNGTSSLTRDSSASDMAYIEVAPAGAVIDGGFSEWSADFLADDVGEDSAGSSASIDISRYGAANDGSQISLYMMTSGDMMGGAKVPYKGGIRVPSGETPGPEVEPDSDGDGIKNNNEPGFEFDFDNDGIPDSQDDDKDNDGILDYGSGGNDTELVQNETKAYKFIGPIDEPPQNGYDTIRIYVNADNDTGTGYFIGNTGADYLIELQGKYGRVKNSSQYIFSGSNSGSWSWSYQGAALFASDTTQLEAGLALSTTGYIDAIFRTESWNEKSDSSEADDVPYVAPPTRSGFAPPSPMADLKPLYNVTYGNGTSNGDSYGWNVSWAGDVNGDGIDDIIIGAPYVTYNSVSACGAAYIFFGRTGFDVAGNNSYMNASLANVTIYGTAANGHFGWDVSDAGDVNGDNYDDVIIGEPDNGNGYAYIFNGRANASWSASYTTASASTSINGEASGDDFGASVSGAGNVDAAGNDDIVIGALKALTSTGSSTQNIFNEDFEGDGTPTYTELGWTTQENGSPSADHWKLTTSPTSGTDHGSWQNDVDSDAGGSVNHDEWLMSPVIDCSGYTDVQLEFWHSYNRYGETSSEGAYVHISTDGGSTWPNEVLHYYAEDHLDTWETIDISSHADGESNVKIRWRYIANYDWWWEVDDVYVNGTVSTYDDTGSVYLFYGDGSIPASAANADVKLSGSSDGDMFGASVSDGGDIDGDGQADVLVGAPGKEETYVYYGPNLDTRTLLFTGNAGEDFGWSVANIGDFFETTTDSVAVGAPSAANGKVYLFSSTDISGGEDEIVNDTSTQFDSGSPTKTNTFLLPSNPVEDGHLNQTATKAFYESHEDSNTGNWNWNFVSAGTARSASGTSIYGSYSAYLNDNDGAGFLQMQETDAASTPDQAMIDFYFRASGDGFFTGCMFRSLSNYYMNIGLCTDGGYIQHYSGGAWTNVMPHVSDTWYWVRIDYDDTADTYDLYINDTAGKLVLRSDDTSFINSGYTIDYIWVDTGNAPDGTAATITAYIDEFHVWTPSTSTGSYTSIAKSYSDNIVSITPYWNTTLAEGSNIWVNISRDGGTTWNASALTNGVEYTFPTEPSGSTFQYKIEFSSDGDYASLLYDVKFIVSTIGYTAVIVGESSGSLFGYSVHGAGDISGDGTDDIIIGAPKQGSGGAVYIFNGSASISGTISAGNADYVNYSMDSGSMFGWSVCKAGDFNNDGYNDIITGAPVFSSSKGKVWVMSIIEMIIIPEFASLGLAIIMPMAAFTIVRDRRKRRKPHDG